MQRTTTAPEGRWQHDKYEDVGDLRQNMGVAKAKAAAKGVVVPKGGLTTGTKITVTNLETAVTQQDMKVGGGRGLLIACWVGGWQVVCVMPSAPAAKRSRPSQPSVCVCGALCATVEHAMIICHD